jgi:hypothetical protein
MFMQPSRLSLDDWHQLFALSNHIAVFDAFDTLPFLLKRLANSPHSMDLFASPQFTITTLHFIIWQDVHRNLDILHRRSLIRIRIRICILGISFDIHRSRYRHNSFVYIPLISISSYHLFMHHNVFI